MSHNIFVERFWRSLKYEDIYLKGYETMQELKHGLRRYFEFFNDERFHQALEYETPNEVYEGRFRLREEQQALRAVV